MLRAWSCQVESMKGPVSQFSTTPTLASSRQSSHIDCLLWAQGGIPQPLLTGLEWTAGHCSRLLRIRAPDHGVLSPNGIGAVQASARSRCCGGRPGPGHRLHFLSTKTKFSSTLSREARQD